MKIMNIINKAIIIYINFKNNELYLPENKPKTKKKLYNFLFKNKNRFKFLSLNCSFVFIIKVIYFLYGCFIDWHKKWKNRVIGVFGGYNIREKVVLLTFFGIFRWSSKRAFYMVQGINLQGDCIILKGINLIL